MRQLRRRAKISGFRRSVFAPGGTTRAATASMKRLSWGSNSYERYALIALAVLFAVAPAVAEEPSSRPLPLGGEECNAWEISYTLAAKLRLTDTPFGAGNGLYD